MPFKLLLGAFYLTISPKLIQVKGFVHFCVCICPNPSLALFSNLVQLKYEEGAARIATPSLLQGLMIRISLDRVMFEKGNISVAELEKKSGVNKNTLHALYKNKSTRLDLSVLERICEALDCEPGELLERGPKEEEAK